MFHCANNNYSTHYLQSQLSIFFFLSSLGCNEEGVWLSTLIIIKEILLKTIYDILKSKLRNKNKIITVLTRLTRLLWQIKNRVNQNSRNTSHSMDKMIVQKMSKKFL